jgi:hypothetical protein
VLSIGRPDASVCSCAVENGHRSLPRQGNFKIERANAAPNRRQRSGPSLAESLQHLWTLLLSRYIFILCFISLNLFHRSSATRFCDPPISDTSQHSLLMLSPSVTACTLVYSFLFFLELLFTALCLAGP